MILLNLKQVSEVTGVKYQTLYFWVKYAKSVPDGDVIKGKRKCYSEAGLREVIKAVAKIKANSKGNK